jgi:hypothetical protein
MTNNEFSSANCRNVTAVVLFLALVVGAANSAWAQYDPSAQFSPINNPNGVWSYGFESVPLGTPFKLLPLPLPVATLPGPAIDSWQSPAFGELGVLHNPTAAAQTVATVSDNAIYDPGMLAMHPGPNDEFGMVQFTAPVNGFYTIQGVFEGIDTAWITSDVHLLWNNVVVANGNVLLPGPAGEVPLSAGPFLLNVGDTLAYAVGGGPFHDTTALIAAHVDAVSAPEPSYLALFGFAIIGLVARGWRRRKRLA